MFFSWKFNNIAAFSMAPHANINIFDLNISLTESFTHTTSVILLSTFFKSVTVFFKNNLIFFLFLKYLKYL